MANKMGSAPGTMADLGACLHPSHGRWWILGVFMATPSIRVLVVDDFAAWRRFVCSKVQNQPSGFPERALIEIQGAEDLYSEIRIENALSDGDGQKVKLKLCEKVNVTIEKTTGGTEKKSAFRASGSR